MVQPPVVSRGRFFFNIYFVEFTYSTRKKPGAVPSVALMYDRCRSNAWWETFITTASE